MATEYRLVEGSDLGALAAQLTQHASGAFKPILMQAVLEPLSEFEKIASQKATGKLRVLVLLEKQ